jgi:hypothetical protein
MDETQRKSPKICFSADSYLVYGIRRDSRSTLTVMAGFVPAIHVFCPGEAKDVDARREAGHDDAAVLSRIAPALAQPEKPKCSGGGRKQCRNGVLFGAIHAF